MPSNAHRSAPAVPSRRTPPIRYAVVGLGHIAQHAVLPGLANAKRNSVLAALVSDDPDKLEAMGKAYRVDDRYGYAQYHDCLRSGRIDAVYIALPNDLHHEYAMRAARAGIHVLCEKPMAVTEEQCKEMIAAARDADVRLMIGYRLHFERANLKAIAAAAENRLGELRFFNSIISKQVTTGDIRTRPLASGGGSLYDLGIYCINAARYLFKSEPIEVTAHSARNGDPRFAEIDEMTAATLRFPGDRLATFTSSFGAAATAAYDLVGTQGSLRVNNAYEYEEKIALTLTIDGKSRTTSFKVSDHFAAEIDYFSTCIRQGGEPEPSGHEGLADVRVICALYESVRIGMPVRIHQADPPVARPDPAQEVTYPPPGRHPAPVHVASSSQDG